MSDRISCEHHVVQSELERSSDAYEVAEAKFLDAVRASQPRDVLATRAAEVADAAEAFNAVAYRQFHAEDESAWMPLDQLTERTEVLSELWRDLATAYSV